MSIPVPVAASKAVGAAGAPTHTAAPGIPFKRDTPGASSPLGNGALGVLVVSLIVIAGVLVVRKRLRLGTAVPGKPALVQVLETQRLGPRSLLSVVEFGGTRYLVAQGEHGISCLASTPVKEQA